MKHASAGESKMGLLPKVLVMVMMMGALSGCKNTYEITLNNGTKLTTSSKPRLEGNFYVYKDNTGRTNAINAMRVQQIEAK